MEGGWEGKVQEREEEERKNGREEDRENGRRE